ncbi:hypothetical protein L6452_35734 [Arctium lappa]|uniref:Uncharacterized protein n=1 Tax=Arctium lappa TaxID=4217 RepID=A0ACB8Y7W4_ARCLA|nr:hypothetical protein L6452_35734 [Arctium lappa]
MFATAGVSRRIKVFDFSTVSFSFPAKYGVTMDLKFHGEWCFRIFKYQKGDLSDLGNLGRVNQFLLAYLSLLTESCRYPIHQASSRSLERDFGSFLAVGIPY